MTMDISEPLPPDEPLPQESLPPARRRRQHRMVAGETSERSEYLADLRHQATPSFDFFLFSLLSGIVLMAAILLDSEALFVLAALLAPFMAPLVGMALAIPSGSIGFFLRSLASLVIGGALVFGMGALAGLLGPADSGALHRALIQHTQFTWPDVVVLVLGMIVTVYLVGRNPNAKPLVSSVALAYVLFLPLGAAGYGTTAAQRFLWPDGLVLFAVFTALAVLVGAVFFIIQGIHPSKAVGVLAGMLLFAALLAGMLGLAVEAWWGSDPFAAFVPPSATATLSITVTATLTFTPLPSLTATATLLPPTPTRTATPTIIPTGTRTVTLNPSPTPLWGLVNAGEGSGIIIRAEPNSSTVVTTLLNGYLIQILPELANKAGVFWIHVRTTTGLEGWVQAGLVATATPRPK